VGEATMKKVLQGWAVFLLGVLGIVSYILWHETDSTFWPVFLSLSAGIVITGIHLLVKE
jgi:uncharacterized membrane protein HdeD (DUF308 family)